MKHKENTTISNLGPFTMFALWLELLKFCTIGKFKIGKGVFFILCFFHAIKINAMTEAIKQKIRGTIILLSIRENNTYVFVTNYYVITWLKFCIVLLGFSALLKGPDQYVCKM